MFKKTAYILRNNSYNLLNLIKKIDLVNYNANISFTLLRNKNVKITEVVSMISVNRDRL